MIKLVAVFITFVVSTIFFSTDRLTPLPISAIKIEIGIDKSEVIGILASNACKLSLKHEEAPIVSCTGTIFEYEPGHTGSIGLSANPNLKSREQMSLITSDHKTNCEYINLFGEQIGDIPRA